MSARRVDDLLHRDRLELCGRGVARASATICVSDQPQHPRHRTSARAPIRSSTCAWPPIGQTKPRTNGFANQTHCVQDRRPHRRSIRRSTSTTWVCHAYCEVPGATVTARDYTVSKNACDFQCRLRTSTTVSGIGTRLRTLSFSVNNPLGYLRDGCRDERQQAATRSTSTSETTTVRSRLPVLVLRHLFDFATPNRY